LLKIGLENHVYCVYGHVIVRMFTRNRFLSSNTSVVTSHTILRHHGLHRRHNLASKIPN